MSFAHGLTISWDTKSKSYKMQLHEASATAAFSMPQQALIQNPKIRPGGVLRVRDGGGAIVCLWEARKYKCGSVAMLACTLQLLISPTRPSVCALVL